ncbi:MAG TPA: ROK family protein [Prosthecobacter sp.]
MRQKTSDLRQLLASTILHVRSGRATSRTMLARAMGISASTTGLYVDQLIASRHLNESGLEHGGMGRPKRKLGVSETPGWFAGVEFTADRMQITGVDFAGAALASEEVRLHFRPTPADVEKVILHAITVLQRRFSRPMLGIGVGAPGLVDTANGISLRYDFIRGWENIPLGKLLAGHFEVPVVIENNLRAIAVAERWFGNRREENDYVIVGARSGFGIASMQAGRLLHGARHAAGEVGLWPWPLSGETPSKELHHVLSAPMTYRRLAGLSHDAPVPDDLYAAFARLVHIPNGEPVWQEVVADYARVLTCIQMVLDPTVCLLHGPLTALGNRFCQAIMEACEKVAPVQQGLQMHLECSRLGDEAGALGAACLAMEAWQPGHL